MRRDCVNSSENTPLRQHQQHGNNNIDSTSSATTSTASCISVPEHNSNMDDTRRIVTKICIDFTVLLCVGLPILAFFLWGDPYKRGFFCDDESLMHPFHDSTVKNYMLYIIGLVLPVGLIIATELIQSKLNKNTANKKLRIGNWEIPTWLTCAYKQVGIFGFGAVVSQLTTDIAKYTIGRLRPHFFSVCQPIMPDGTNCSNPINIGKYIEEFTCLGVGSNPRMLKEVRLSFPSGHSSFSAYTMIYCAIYLQSRMTWRGSKLLKNLLQFVLVMLAWYTALSRISDYKHHWSDVLTGATLGTFCALIVASFVNDLCTRRNSKLLPQTKYELATPTNGTSS